MRLTLYLAYSDGLDLVPHSLAEREPSDTYGAFAENDDGSSLQICFHRSEIVDDQWRLIGARRQETRRDDAQQAG